MASRSIPARSFARITCEAPTDDGLAWLLGFDGSQLIVVSATDADGAIATASTRVALVGSLPPPVQIRCVELPHVGRPAGRAGRVAALARRAAGYEPHVPVPLARARRERLDL